MPFLNRFSRAGSTFETLGATEFTLFPALPKELRDLVWKESLPEERFVPIRIVSAEKCGANMGLLYSPAPVPAALHVCSESRQVARNMGWSKEFGTFGKAAALIWFNFERDVLYFPLVEVMKLYWYPQVNWWVFVTIFREQNKIQRMATVGNFDITSLSAHMPNLKELFILLQHDGKYLVSRNPSRPPYALDRDEPDLELKTVTKRIMANLKGRVRFGSKTKKTLLGNRHCGVFLDADGSEGWYYPEACVIVHDGTFILRRKGAFGDSSYYKLLESIMESALDVILEEGRVLEKKVIWHQSPKIRVGILVPEQQSQKILSLREAYWRRKEVMRGPCWSGHVLGDDATKYNMEIFFGRKFLGT